MNDRLNNIALIGVGLMGHGIAKNLLLQGYPVRLFAHAGNSDCTDLMALGAESCESYSALCADTHIIMLCVTGSPEVESIVRDHLIPHLQQGDTIIDCSTGLPQVSVPLAAELAEKGVHYHDAPMTKTPKEAESGTLNLLVGGDINRIETLRPILSCFAEKIVHAGTIGSGQGLKLLHNFVSLGFANILCEAAAVARLHNIDAYKLVQVLDTGGGKGTILERLKPMIQHSDDSNFIFSLKNCAKDIEYYQQFSENQLAIGSIAPQMSAIFHQAVRETSPHTTIPNLIPIQAQTNNNDE